MKSLIEVSMCWLIGFLIMVSLMIVLYTADNREGMFVLMTLLNLVAAPISVGLGLVKLFDRE